VTLPILAPVLGILGLLMAFVVYRHVVAQPAGSGAMTEIADAIEDGAMAFLRKEYSILVWFIVIVAILLSLGIGSRTALAFVSGAICSMLAGFIGMKAATKANVRTAQAARTVGRDKALAVAFFGGSVMGLTIAALGILAWASSSSAGRSRSSSAASPWAPRRSRSSPEWAEGSTRSRPTSAPTSSARSRRASPRTTRAIPPSSPTTSATTWATSPAWAPTSSSPTSAPSWPPSPSARRCRTRSR